MANEVILAKNLFAVVENALFLGDRFTSGEFGVLMQPGQFIGTDLKESDASDDMAIIYDLCNEALDSSFLYKPLTFVIGNIYSDILQFAALPYKALTPTDQRELAKLRDWIAEYGPVYDIYQDRYFDALDAYEQEAKSQIPSGAVLRRLRQKVDQASNRWVTLGYKNEYENKVGRFAYLSQTDPSALFNEMRLNFQFHTKDAPRRGKYFQTFLTPAISSWTSPATSWAAFEKSFGDSEQTSYSKVTNWSSRVSGGWGLFSGRAGASGSRRFSHQSSEATTVSVQFEYLRVRIQRPWLRPDVFGYRFWSWKNTVGYRLLSDGGNLAVSPPIRPIGELPILQTHLIIAKNLEISANFAKNDRKYIDSNISGSANAGWGCFGFSGSYSEGEKEERVQASFDGTTIRVQHPQIIGFMCRVMPLSPNPDRHLPWQSDASLPDDAVLSKWAAEIRRSDYEADRLIGDYIENQRSNQRAIAGAGVSALSDALRKIGEPSGEAIHSENDAR